MSFTLKKFETAGEIEEKKKKRQEEWEKVRKPDDPEGNRIMVMQCYPIRASGWILWK